jgi:DNA repair protein RecO (recombination protein O)
MRYGEADRILTLYTRDRGRIGVIAKGVRRTKSKTASNLSVWCASASIREEVCTTSSVSTLCGPSKVFGMNYFVWKRVRAS